MTREQTPFTYCDTGAESSAILVVDDEPDILFFVVRALQCMAIDAAGAEDGEQALRLLAERPFGAMLTDLNMPGIDGLELARRARRLQPELRVILGTGSLYPGLREQAVRAGISEVIGKPFEVENIFRLLSKALA